MQAAKSVILFTTSCLPSVPISRFTLSPGSGKDEEIDYRQCNIHPAERCVVCYIQHEGRLSSGKTHMKTEGRTPSPRLSACRSVVVAASRRRKLRPHFELEADDCRVVRASSRGATGETEEFPFFHRTARQPKVSRDEGGELHADAYLGVVFLKTLRLPSGHVAAVCPK